MLILLSPAKTLNFNCDISDQICTSVPYFDNEAHQLIQILKKYSSEELASLMKMSLKLGEFNYQRFQNYDSSDSRPAIYAYNGDVYEGFELSEYNQETQAFANKTLRILSGLYGILKPFDLIKAYRLEMSIHLKNEKGKNLYDFWSNKLTDYLNNEQGKFIINLASQEYSSVINLEKINKKRIDVIFKEKQNNGYKIIGLHAKKARGVMANFIIRNYIVNPAHIKDFNLNGYKYMPELSSEVEYVFIR